MTTLALTDWRSEFRLHAMDIAAAGCRGAGSGQHWVLQDETIREWLAGVANEYEKLIALGGDPFDGGPMTPEAVFVKLGFAQREKPRGFFATARFTSELVSRQRLARPPALGAKCPPALVPAPVFPDH